MNVLDWILLAIRWIHALAAVAWVGGGIFYVLVLRPALNRAGGETSAAMGAIGIEFRGLVNTAIGVLLLTGVILSVSRLTAGTVTIPYVAVLAAKIGLALYMFYAVRFLRRATYPGEPAAARGRLARMRNGLTGTTALPVIGVVIIGLSDLLDALFEQGLVD